MSVGLNKTALTLEKESVPIQTSKNKCTTNREGKKEEVETCKNCREVF